MIDHQTLLHDLELLTKGVASLYLLEENEVKKKLLDCIFKGLLSLKKQIDNTHDEDNHSSLNGNDNDLAASTWTEIRQLFIRYGAKELFDRLFDFF